MANATSVMQCALCHHKYGLDLPRWHCGCGGYLNLICEDTFPSHNLDGRELNLWRYRESFGLPQGTEAVSLGEVLTPLLWRQFQGFNFGFKCDYVTPTGSYKDRGTTVMVSYLKSCGVTKVIEDSSGNAGSSVAAYAAAAGIEAEIFVPINASPGKITQIRAYGAALKLISGNRGEVAQAAREAGKACFYAGHSWNPFFLVGLKSLAFELVEQNGWTAPDAVIAPLGGGGLILGLYSGFAELVTRQLIRKIPRLIGVQSSACAPVYEAWQNGRDDVKALSPTFSIAEGIMIDRPVRSRDILNAVSASKGKVVKVDDEQICEALQLLGGLGLYVEPTSGAAPAAAIELARAGDISEAQQVVVVLSGNGLKATHVYQQLQGTSAPTVSG